MSFTALIVGFGSIGERHARVAASLGGAVAVVTKRTDVEVRRFGSVEQAAGDREYDVVIIANETGKHWETLRVVAECLPKSKVLVEKPLFDADLPPPPGLPAATYVGYCLRFHPAILEVLEHLRDRRIFAIRASVGQHLSTWRPGRDYRTSYSARRGEGGALRDLSHELDLVQFVAGRWQRVAALVGQISDLEISSDDVASLIMTTERCPHVCVHLDLIDRSPRRSLIVHAEGTTVEADLIAGQIVIDGVPRPTSVERDALYSRQLRAILEQDARFLCTVQDARHTLRLIEAAELASKTSSWQSNPSAESK
jgi:predicted dehydrogenase